MTLFLLNTSALAQRLKFNRLKFSVCFAGGGSSDERGSHRHTI